jgi:membrane fusion protein (multidrug efflux system)
MRLDGFPWAQYGSVEAKVVRVAGEIRDNALRVELVLQANQANNAASNAYVQHGLSGTVEIGTERLAPAVLVLRAAGQMVSRQPRAAADGPAQ